MESARQLFPAPGRLNGSSGVAIGGSMSDDWNNVLSSQTIQTLWLKRSDAVEISGNANAAVDAVIGTTLRDEFEAMIAVKVKIENLCSLTFIIGRGGIR